MRNTKHHETETATAHASEQLEKATTIRTQHVEHTETGNLETNSRTEQMRKHGTSEITKADEMEDGIVKRHRKT